MSFGTLSFGRLLSLIMGAPADPVPLFFNDTFTGSAGALAGTASDIGGTWSVHPASVGGTSRSGTGIYHPTSDPASLMINSQTPPDADYYVEGDLLVKTVIAGTVSGVNGRMDGTAATFYGLRYNSSSFILFKSNAGTLTTLATYTATQPTGVTAVLRLEMLGDQISGYVDGVLRCGPVTDTSITAAGKIGTRMYGNVATTSTGQHLEAMRAGVLTIAMVMAPISGGFSISSAPDMGSSFTTSPSAGSIGVS